MLYYIWLMSIDFKITLIKLSDREKFSDWNQISFFSMLTKSADEDCIFFCGVFPMESMDHRLWSYKIFLLTKHWIHLETRCLIDRLPYLFHLKLDRGHCWVEKRLSSRSDMCSSLLLVVVSVRQGLIISSWLHLINECHSCLFQLFPSRYSQNILNSKDSPLSLRTVAMT